MLLGGGIESIQVHLCNCSPSTVVQPVVTVRAKFEAGISYWSGLFFSLLSHRSNWGRKNTPHAIPGQLAIHIRHLPPLLSSPGVGMHCSYKWTSLPLLLHIPCELCLLLPPSPPPTGHLFSSSPSPSDAPTDAHPPNKMHTQAHILCRRQVHLLPPASFVDVPGLREEWN